MSFVMEPDASPPEEGEQRTWLKQLEEEAAGSPDVARRRAAESLQATRAQKLSRQLIIVWGAVLLLAVVYVGVHAGAQKTKRGKDNAMWLITVALMDSSLILGALLLSALGLWMRDEIYMRQSSILQVITASWYIVQVAFNMVFVVILSKIGGEWQRHGKYTSEQITDFNKFVVVFIVFGGMLAPVTFYSSRVAWNLCKMYEVERVVRRFPEREEEVSRYGTFTRAE